MTPSVQEEIRKVAEKVDFHQKKSDEFYTEMRTNFLSMIGKLDRLQESVLKSELKIESFEERLRKAEEKLEISDKKTIYLISGLIFIGFLVIILFAQ